MRIECLLCCFSVFKSVLSMSGPDSQGPMFITEPRSTIEFANDVGAIVPCTAHGSPDPIITWLMADGTSVTPVLHIRELTKNGSLYFPPFGAESYRHDVHSTAYRCEASNSVGRILSREVNVKAVVKQHYDVSVRDAYVLSGNIAVLRCEVPNFVKEHVSVTSWVQDSSFNIFPTPYSESKQHMLPSGELLVYSVTASDSHPTYRCRTVHHITGKTIESSTYGRVIVTENRGSVPPRYHEKVTMNPVREGEVAVLSCVSQGYPPPNYFWFKSSSTGHLEPLVPSEKTHMKDGVLIIQNAQVNDSGRYVCIANNTAGSERVELQLTILVPLLVHLAPQHVTVDIGHDTELACAVSGHPNPVITWRKDTLPLRDTSHRIRMTGHSNSRLQITRVSREDRGMYQCFAKNDYEMSQGTAELRLGDASPQLMYKFIEQTMQPGPSVSLKCIAAGNPTPQFTWTLDGFALPQSERLVIGQYVTVHGDVISHVNISSVRVEDGGEYRCTAKNRVGSSGHSARLNIYGLPLVRPMSTIAAVAGHDLVLQCPVAGYPISTITWEKDGQLLPMDRRQEVSPNGTLVIRKVDSATDRGLYTCLARNKQGHEDSKSVQIEVKVPPRWSVPPENQQAPQGAHGYTLDCQAEGNPTPSVTWRRQTGTKPGTYRDLAQQEHGSGIRIYSNGSLFIERLREEHEGYYICEAFNGIGTGLSKRIYLTVNAPAHFVTKHKNHTARLGSSATLRCEAKGDRPIKIIWRKAGSSLEATAADYRYSYKVMNTTDTVVSELTISNTLRDDSGRYHCSANNLFGRDEMTLQLYIQEPPDFPRNVHVIEKGSRFVKLGWVLSQDGNSPIIQCIVEYKTESEAWHKQTTQTTVPANQATVLISSLRPAVNYQFRLFAENELGKSQASDILDVTTDSEVPSGAPRNLQVDAVSATELHVIWDAPERELWNGEILGYHVGYKEQRLKEDQYQFKNVESRGSGSGGETSLTDLKKFAKYSIVVQAYNALGPGPTSSEVLAVTLEDVPSAAPQDIRCTAFSSQSLQVSWSPVPDTQLHGHLKGYKVIWENLEDFDISNKPEAKITTALSVVIHGLEKFTNYSVQVLAFTNAGDGVSSSPLHCLTNEDVPEVPSAIKAVVSSPTSIVVSWLPPTRTNGILTSYNLQMRSVGGPNGADSKPKRHSVQPHHTFYEEEGLNKRGQYEFTVAAVTKVGEGAKTQPVTLSPTSEVRAAIYSFGSITILPWKSDARLPCRSVGKPEPSLIWRQAGGHPLKASTRFKIQNDGSLQIFNLIRDDTGNYSCYVENRYGSDTIIHRLTVQVPPASPFLHATSATSSSLNVQWKQGDDGGAPIRGYHLHFKKENGEWESVQVGRQQSSYLLTDLFCGTPYQIYVEAFNHIGKGDKSAIVSATTDGSKPSSVPKESFLVPNMTYVTLYLENWLDNGCPILYFELDYRRVDESKWTLVSNSLEKQKHFLLKNLQPGTEYVLRVKAHNNAGSAKAEYRFFTLRKVGGTVSPSLTRHSGQTEIPFYLDLRLVLPLFVSCLAVFSAVLAVYYCLNKRPILGESLSLRESQSSAALDNKQNMQQREQYYATVRKPLRSPVREIPTLERIPEYSEDIYPYATFQLNQTSAGGETRCTSGAPLDRGGGDLEDLDRERERGTPLQTFLYHDPLLTTAETLQLRETSYITGQSPVRPPSPRRYSRGSPSPVEDDPRCYSWRVIPSRRQGMGAGQLPLGQQGVLPPSGRRHLSSSNWNRQQGSPTRSS